MTFTNLLAAAGLSAGALTAASGILDATESAIAGYQSGIMSALTSSGVAAQDLGAAPGESLGSMSYGELVSSASGGDVTGVETDNGAWIPFGAAGIADAADL